MDFFGFVGFIIAIMAYAISIYKILDGRQERQKSSKDLKDDAMLFLRDFNKEGWPSGIRIGTNPRSQRYWEQVAQLRSYRSLYPDDLKRIVVEYLTIAHMKLDQNIRERSARLKELEKTLRSEAEMRLRKE